MASRRTPKVFITGVTGYIGGDAFYVLHKAHPDWQYTCLVRSSDKGAQVASQYASVRLVYGDLDSSQLIEEEARNADVVCHFANADHAGAATAIGKGLASHAPSNPGFWIHTSGTGILMYPDVLQHRFGESTDKIWDDLNDIEEIVNQIPEKAPHRKVDMMILAAHSDSVKTTIVCPPCIYGQGRGPGNQRSIQLPDLVSSFLKRGEAFHVGNGKASWSNVHVHDLSSLYLLLAEAASVSGGGKATWGSEGYYFAENGERVWGEVSREVALKLQKLGLLKDADPASISVEDANALRSHGGLLWGANSRSRASRARKILGWKPKAPRLEDVYDETIEIEKASLG